MLYGASSKAPKALQRIHSNATPPQDRLLLIWMQRFLPLGLLEYVVYMSWWLVARVTGPFWVHVCTADNIETANCDLFTSCGIYSLPSCNTRFAFSHKCMSSQVTELVNDGFFTDMLFYRIIQGFLAQFGVPADHAAYHKWNSKPRLLDEPNLVPFRRGEAKVEAAFCAACVCIPRRCLPPFRDPFPHPTLFLSAHPNCLCRSVRLSRATFYVKQVLPVSPAGQTSKAPLASLVVATTAGVHTSSSPLGMT